MSTTAVNIRVDEDLKQQADELFKKLGMTLSSGINIFLAHSVRQRALPFDVTLHVPNEDTQAAMREGKRLAKNSKTKRYGTVDALMKDLLA